MRGCLVALAAIGTLVGCQPAPGAAAGAAVAADAGCRDWSGIMDFSGSERVPQPPFETTGDPYHLALAFGADDYCLEKPRAQADFFAIGKVDGPTRFTRYGEFELDAAREIVHVTGAPVHPWIQVPAYATAVTIDVDGLVRVTRPGSDRPEEIGVIQVARFPKASALKALGGGMFEATAEAGAPVFGRPTIEGHGRVYQGRLDRAEATRTTPPAL